MKLDISEKNQDDIDIDKIYDEIGEQNKKSIDEALKNIPKPNPTAGSSDLEIASFCEENNCDLLSGFKQT